MIQDTDEDILNSDFLKWTVSIKQSFRYQINASIRKRIIDDPPALFPFTTNLYIHYKTSLSGLFIPLSLPIEVFIISADKEDIEYCVNSVFDILLDKMRSGLEIVGNSQNTHDYRYFYPLTSETVKGSSSNFDLKTDLPYTTKNMKSNSFKDTYENLQRTKRFIIIDI